MMDRGQASKKRESKCNKSAFKKSSSAGHGSRECLAHDIGSLESLQAESGRISLRIYDKKCICENLKIRLVKEPRRTA